MSDRPAVAIVTMTRWGPVYPRTVGWLGEAFRTMEVNADIVYLEGPRSDLARGSVREVRLGATRARWALPKLVRYLRDRQPEVTLATPGSLGLLTLAAGILTRQAVVPWETTIPRLDQKDLPLWTRPNRVLSPFFYGRAARVAAVSDAVRDALAIDLKRTVPGDRLVVIASPINGDDVRRSAQPPAPRSGRTRFCSIGRLVSAKGFDVLIEACALLTLPDPWELLIIGEGPLRGQLQRLIDQHDLGDKVRLLGHLENPYPTLASADVAVQASRWEGFGVTILEALALGVPQVATACPGGLVDILGDGKFGILAPVDDRMALAQALTMIVNDSERRLQLSRDGPGRAKEYDALRVADRIVALVEEIRNDGCIP